MLDGSEELHSGEERQDEIAISLGGMEAGNE
jgi:hypothetical protein